MAEHIVLKRCPACQESKPITEFYRNRARSDGLTGECKECHKKAAKTYNHSAKGKKVIAKRRASAAYIAGQLRYHRSEKTKAHKKAYCATPCGRAIKTKAVAKWRTANPEKARTHRRIRDLVKRGMIPPACDCVCISCNKPAAHYHHHNGYDDSHLLDIIPVCIQCHVNLHRTAEVT